jgi:hypothetical protein
MNWTLRFKLECHLRVVTASLSPFRPSRHQHVSLGVRRGRSPMIDDSTTAGNSAVLFSTRSGIFQCPLGSHAFCMDRIAGFSENPDAAEIAENSHCKVCKADWKQSGLICRHCTVGSEPADLVPERVTLIVLRCLHGLARGPVGMSVLGNTEKGPTLDQAATFFDLLDVMERAAAWRFWTVHLDLLNDLDELRQCKAAMR